MNIFAVFFAWRPSTLRAITFCGVCPFLVGWGGFYYNNRHIPPWIAISLMFIGGISGAAGVKQTLINFHKSNKTATVWGVIVFIAVTFLTAGDVFFELNSGQGAYPHITFSLRIEGAPSSDSLDLTNDFLMCSKVRSREEPSFKQYNSILFMPRQPENAYSTLVLIANSYSPADEVMVKIILSEDWKCIPDIGWQQAENASTFMHETASGILVTNDLKKWAYAPTPDFNLLPGDGEAIPSLQILQLSQPAPFNIMVQSKTSPNEEIGFFMTFSEFPNSVVKKPFLLEATQDEHGLMRPIITKQKIDELVRQGFISAK